MAAATDLDLPDCAHVYYVKQLSPSDAACSKQIKLPKTEARKFVGDLRHKQSTIVTFIDPLGEAWEFLCTCYGCQYALSRVGTFCTAFRLKAGQYMLFYADAGGRLVRACCAWASGLACARCSCAAWWRVCRRLCLCLMTRARATACLKNNYLPSHEIQKKTPTHPLSPLSP